MCGLTGFVSFTDGVIDGETLARMTRSLAHRGPNDSGCVVLGTPDVSPTLWRDTDAGAARRRGPVGLGHRRLSIIDLSDAGRQPMTTADGGVWLVFNGEIYNYVELRSELMSLGHRFHTATDTEVVLLAYRNWGSECFRRFNGMWAIALYDERTRELILSRDRFGEKPLYYYRAPSFVAFASEIKALFQHPRVPKAVNERKVAAYAGGHYRYVDDDCESFFEGIEQVPSGSFMACTRDGHMLTERYWSLDPEKLPPPESDERDIVARFRDLLDDAVRIRLRSDVPVGCMLSGGLDSGSIASLAHRRYAPLHCFSGVTGRGYFDESEYIDALVGHTGVDHVYVYPQPAALIETVREMLAFHDEPICTVTWFANYLLTREVAKSRIPVILTGHGGDELLAGYWDHYHHFFADLRERASDAAEVAAWNANHNRGPDEYAREADYIARSTTDPSVAVGRYMKYQNYLAPRLHASRVARDHDAPFRGHLSRRLYIEMFQETIPPSLRAEDRNMMAFSIENRVPLLDYRLAEFCFALENGYKIRGGLGKWLLREAMCGVLPEKVRARKDKTGFNAPLGEWIRGENRAEFEALLARVDYVNSEVYDIDEVRALFRRHLAGEEHYMFFWQYLNLNLWFDGVVNQLRT